jgi:hypothetical protein
MVHKKRISKKQDIFNQLTPAEYEFIMDTYGKPAKKLTTKQLEKEWKDIKITWGF